MIKVHSQFTDIGGNPFGLDTLGQMRRHKVHQLHGSIGQASIFAANQIPVTFERKTRYRQIAGFRALLAACAPKSPTNLSPTRRLGVSPHYSRFA